MDVSSKGERFLEFFWGKPLQGRVRECLRKSQIEAGEFERMLAAYLDAPQQFVLCGNRTDARKRNNVISLFQLLRGLHGPKSAPGIDITFLSSGTSVSQGDSLGHFDITVDDLSLRFDPGPGALATTLNLIERSGGQAGNDPLWLDAILMTHIHNDHTGGFQEIFERMRWGGLINSRDKFVIANRTCIDGNASFHCGPLLDKYKKAAVQAVALGPGDSITIKDVEIKGTRAVHVEAFDGKRRLEDTCLGYKLSTRYGNIGITGDTEWYPGLEEEFYGVDILIAYVTQEAERSGTPTQKDYGLAEGISCHRQFLGEEGVTELVRRAQPTRCVLLTDFGDQLKSPQGDYDIIPQIMAARIKQSIGTKVPIKAVSPGMVLSFNGESLLFRQW